MNTYNFTEQDKQQLQWYVIGKKIDFPFRVPIKITIWGKHYVVCKTSKNSYTCLSDISLYSGDSVSKYSEDDIYIVCPGHKNQDNKYSKVTHINANYLKEGGPYDTPTFQVIENNDWIYMNTQEQVSDSLLMINHNASEIDVKYSLTIQKYIDINAIILLENSLDMVHIVFAKLFTNKDVVEPLHISAPYIYDALHHHINYTYRCGQFSPIRHLFDVNEIIIANEVILPYTTLSRIIVGDKQLIFETHILPIESTKSKVFVKCYSNFKLHRVGRILVSETMSKILDVYEQIYRQPTI